MLAQRPTQPVKPAAGVPLGVLRLLIRSIELKSSDTCFLLLKAGPQWGRSATLSSNDKRLDFNWEVGGFFSVASSPFPKPSARH